MHEVTVTRDLNHDAKTVWDLLDDFGSIYKYNPGVKSSELLTEKQTGIGAKRICKFYDGTSLKEEITQYKSGKGYTFELSEFSLPLKKAYTKFEVVPVNSGHSRIKVSLQFTPKFGPVGWLMANLMMKPMLKKALSGLLKGVDDHLSSGKMVGPKGKLLQAA